jgi:hypothetical protein
MLKTTIKINNNRINSLIIRNEKNPHGNLNKLKSWSSDACCSK